MGKVKRGERRREVVEQTKLEEGQIWETSEPVQILEVMKILERLVVCRVLKNDLLPRKRGTKTHIRLENFLLPGWKKLTLSEVKQIQEEEKPQRTVVDFPKFAKPTFFSPVQRQTRYIAKSR